MQVRVSSALMTGRRGMSWGCAHSMGTITFLFVNGFSKFFFPWEAVLLKSQEAQFIFYLFQAMQWLWQGGAKYPGTMRQSTIWETRFWLFTLKATAMKIMLWIWTDILETTSETQFQTSSHPPLCVQVRFSFSSRDHKVHAGSIKYYVVLLHKFFVFFKMTNLVQICQSWLNALWVQMFVNFYLP